ncbi:MAG: transposase [Spirochaetaceae bacterium]|nr:MAG: transposase [Spirochaetaceae bacterium]
MRKPRLIKQDSRYHVSARANRREMILGPQFIKELFLKTVIRAKSRYKFEIISFCLMENHFHFIIRPCEKQSLSKIMQWILSVFAVSYNKTIGENGHVWYDRFWSRPIDDIRQFISVFEYIMANPVKAKMVRKEEDYAFSGIRHLLDRNYSVLSPPCQLIWMLFPKYISKNLIPGK